MNETIVLCSITPDVYIYSTGGVIGKELARLPIGLWEITAVGQSSRERLGLWIELGDSSVEQVMCTTFAAMKIAERLPVIESGSWEVKADRIELSGKESARVFLESVRSVIPNMATQNKDTN